MKRAKPIEAGCKAMTLPIMKDAWLEVTPIRFIGEDADFQDGDKDLWIIDKEITWYRDSVPEKSFTCPASGMIRIDDDEIQSQIESEIIITVDQSRGIESGGYVPVIVR